MIGLIGGIGSGKSRLARWIKQQRNITIIDGDKIGHEVLEKPTVRQQIRSRFGDAVFDAEGHVNRRKLGRLVFGVEGAQRAARRDLEAMMHPAIRESIAEQIAETRRRGTAEAVLLDAAVLLEAAWDDLCDFVVFVDVPHDVRLSRITSTRGWSAGDFDSRESSQLSLKKKRAAAQFAVDNSGPVETAGAQLLNILEQTKRSHLTA